jgi:YidC/Oxa1 family membrane protein insertase
MEKRTLLAIALSFLVIFFWSKFVYRPPVPQAQLQPPSADVTTMPQQSRAENMVTPPAVSGLQTNQQEYLIPGATIIIEEPLAAIKEAIFDKYKKNPYVLNRGFYLVDPTAVFTQKIAVNDGYSYVYEDKTRRITETLVQSKSIYCMDLSIKITNLSPASLSYNSPIILGRIDLSKNSGAGQRFDGIIISDKTKVIHPNFKKAATFPDIKFIGMRDQYFCAILQPESTGYSGFVNQVSDKVYDIGVSVNKIDILPGNEVIQKFKVYLGPQDTDLIAAGDPAWGAIVHFGMFDLVGQAIFGLLKFLFNLVHNWGMAIVLMTLIIYVILFPLSVKQMKSMKEMQVLQPKMEQLRKTYANDTKKLNEEMMKLYKEHKVNPLGGCLPMILQIPIFIALYQVLSRSIALKGASFLWIKDLSEPDRLFRLPVTVPFIGEYFNILPILMALGMFVQQKMSAVNTAGQAAEQQKMMMTFIPIFMGIMFYNVPSGLVMYWFLNSTLMLLYQIKVMKSK